MAMVSTTAPSTQNVPNLWGRFPQEIRREVFFNLGVWTLSMNAPEARFASYATVCREWQEYFESITFQSLVLNQDRLAQLETIVSRHPRRVGFVRHVHLRLELPEYDCKRCKRPETKAEEAANDRIFTTAAVKLFGIISTWPATQGKACILEMSAHSPSDWQHRFKRLRLYKDTSLHHYRPQPNQVISSSDHAHNWVPMATDDGLQHMSSVIPPNSVKRVVGSELKLTADVTELPAVEKFNIFILRRQFYRNFRVVGGLNVILNAMPRLAWFRYEPWHGVSQEDCIRQDLDHEELFQCLFAHEQLSKVHIFKSFEDKLSHGYRRGNRNLPGPDGSMGQLLAESSRNIRRLCLSYITDAMDFFQVFSEARPGLPSPGEMRWNRLKTLILTSNELQEGGDHDNLVQYAAAAAKNMPQLELMVIWNSGDGHGAFFRYKRDLGDDEAPKLTLGSTWHFELSDDAWERWHEVTQVNECRWPLELEYDELEEELMKSYSSLAYLPCKWGHIVEQVATMPSLNEMVHLQQCHRY